MAVEMYLLNLAAKDTKKYKKKFIKYYSTQCKPIRQTKVLTVIINSKML